MAKKYNLTTAFTTITETSGTIQNVGAESVELVSSTNAVAGEGIVLNPSEKRSFKGELSARSLGDAGAVVNVVDFTEAGEGGEEYILPVASDTTLGGVKISNSFTVANDGTLNIKKAGKTILGAVKSSDDAGKVTVNNDATMTYNPLGYRQPSTTYAVGNIAYHSALPTGWYLECTTAGTSGSGELTISSLSIGSTVSDGTVTWTINKDLGSVTGEFYGDRINRDVDTSLLTLCGGKTTQKGGSIKLYGQSSGGAGKIEMSAAGYDNDNNLKVATLQIEKDGSLSLRPTAAQNNTTYDLAGSAIVAKSLGANGYIKYASGLTMQWGNLAISTSGTKINFPISFSTAYQIVGTGAASNGAEVRTWCKTQELSGATLLANTNATVLWFAIGY